MADTQSKSLSKMNKKELYNECKRLKEEYMKECLFSPGFLDNTVKLKEENEKLSTLNLAHGETIMNLEEHIKEQNLRCQVIDNMRKENETLFQKLVCHKETIKKLQDENKVLRHMLKQYQQLSNNHIKIIDSPEKMSKMDWLPGITQVKTEDIVKDQKGKFLIS